MHRIVVRVAQLFLTLVVGIAIIGSLAVWRLSKGPVSLDFLTPVIESSFAVQSMPVAVQVDETTLVWGGWHRVFDLRALNVRVFGSDGKIVALLPEVSIGLAAKGLLRGDLAISRLDVIGLRAVLTRHADGRFDFAVPIDSKEPQDPPGSFGDAASEVLQSVREKRGPFRYLERFSILSAKLRYVDAMNRQLWTMPAADMITVFGPSVVESRFNIRVENAGASTDLAATVLQDRQTGRIGGRIDFDKLQPTLIARAVPQLSQLAGVRMPFSGSAHFDVEAAWQLIGLRLQLASEAGSAVIALRYPQAGERVQMVARLDDVRVGVLARATPALASLAGIDVPVSGQLEGSASSASDFRLARIDLIGGKGAVELPGILPRRTDVTEVRLFAHVREDASSIEVKELALDLDGPRLRMSGVADRDGERYKLRAKGTVTAVPLAALDHYWPVALGPHARRWVIANIVDGIVDDGNFTIKADLSADNPTSGRIEDIHGTLTYRGLSVDYLAPMSKFTGVGGTADFNRTRFDLKVSEGRLRDITVERATIKMFDLDTDIEKIAIDIAMRGPARTLARVLDEQPLGFLGALTLSPTAISGDATAQTQFRFPLRRDLKPEMVKVSATGTLHNLAIAPAPRGLSVSDGELSVKADNAALSATGSAVISGVRATVDWQEHFAPMAKERRKLIFSGRVADMRKPGFGLPELRFLAGPADASVVVTQQRDGQGELLANLEIANTRVDLPAFGWVKESGVPGSANVALRFDGKGLRRVDKLNVDAGKARLLGSAEAFGDDRQAWIATVERFESSGNDLRGRIEIRPNGAVDADLTGKRFDVAGLLDGQGAANGRADEPALPPIGIKASFADLRWGPDRRLANASILVKYADKYVQGLTLDGRLGRDGTLNVRYLPAPDGHVLRIASDDFGAILGMSPSRSKVEGGALVVRGLRRAPDAPLEGDFFASRFTLSRAPLLARVLQVASLTGIGDALTRKGLPFDAFEGQFSYSDGRVTFTKASAYGSSIGVTGNGVLDVDKDSVSISGTVVPAYTLNRVIGKIPVIGSLLTGGENEGIFAATYRVDGPIDDPKIEVNPLSALAPGFLRNLFGLGADKAPVPSANQ